jgi:colanic acid biosynthesis protein WcaH
MSLWMQPEDFMRLVDLGPLVAIDLIVVNPKGELLVGKRTNRPAQGYWFVPGGRIAKGETLDAAFARITNAELGRALDRENATLEGAWTHIYEDNFYGRPGITTHYVVLGHRLDLDLDLATLPVDQHGEYRWVSPSDAETARTDGIHDNTIAYFATLKR